MFHRAVQKIIVARFMAHGVTHSR